MPETKPRKRILFILAWLFVLLVLMGGAAAALEYWSIQRRFTSDRYDPLEGIVQAPVSTTTVFQNVAVWDGTASAVYPRQSVVVENGKVTAIADAIEGLPPGAEVVDGTGCTLIPGLIDAHVHLMSDSGPDFLFRSHKMMNDWITTTSRYPSGRAVIVQRGQMKLEAGVTTMRILGDGYYSLAYRDDAARWDVVAPRILSAGLHVNGPHGYISGGIAADLEPSRRARAALELTSFESIEAAMREHLARGVDVVKISTTHSNLGFGDAAPDLPEEWVREIVRIAHARNIKVTAHSYGREGNWAAIRGGVDGIEHLVNVPHELPEDLINEIVRRDITVTPALAGSAYSTTKFLDDPELLNTDNDLATHVPADVRGNLYAAIRVLRIPGLSFVLTGEWNASSKWRLWRRYTLSNTAKLYKRGVRLIFGTDTPFVFGNFHHSVMNEIRALREAGIPNVDILRMATSTAAGALGLSASVGTIEVGKTADLVLLEGNPLADIEAVRAVRLVMKEGRIVFRRGK
jgi:imidazolonepropionase-like amidohydrolase